MTERQNTLTRGANWFITAFIKNADGTPFNLAGFTPTAEFRATKIVTGTLLGTFTATSVDADIDGEAVGFQHAVELELGAVATAAIAAGVTEGFWDIKLTPADPDDVVYPDGTSGKILIANRVTA